MTFSKNKIKGISFHHRSGKKSLKHAHKLRDFFNIDELYLQIKKETPTRFTNRDIKRFLGDHGRNEINSQISQCVDFISKWTGILKVVERCFPNKYFLNHDYLTQMSHSPLEESALENDIEIYLFIKKLIGLWKHNLHILEMTAQAQYFVRKSSVV